MEQFYEKLHLQLTDKKFEKDGIEYLIMEKKLGIHG